MISVSVLVLKPIYFPCAHKTLSDYHTNEVIEFVLKVIVFSYSVIVFGIIVSLNVDSESDIYY